MLILPISIMALGFNCSFWELRESNPYTETTIFRIKPRRHYNRNSLKIIVRVTNNSCIVKYFSFF